MMKYFSGISPRLIFLLFAISLVSCTIQKRHKLSGYHVEWNKRGSQILAQRTETPSVSLTKDVQLDQDQAIYRNEPKVHENVGFASEENRPSYLENQFTFYGKLLAGSLSQPKNDTCDLLITAQGEFINASDIIEESNVIRFTVCGDTNRTRRVIAKESLFMVKYTDGSKLVLGRPDKDSKDRSERVKDKPDKPKRNKGFRFVDEVSFVGFIFGLGSVPTWFFYWQMGFFISIFAILMGVVGLIRIAKSKGSRTGLGFAIVSLVLGIAMFVATLIFWLPALA